MANVVEYLVERFRRQPKNLRLAGKRVQHLKNFISRRRTNLAEVLCQNQIGGKFAQKLLVHAIKARDKIVVSEPRLATAINPILGSQR